MSELWLGLPLGLRWGLGVYAAVTYVVMFLVLLFLLISDLSDRPQLGGHRSIFGS